MVWDWAFWGWGESRETETDYGRPSSEFQERRGRESVTHADG
jgi:hypothetical protein